MQGRGDGQRHLGLGLDDLGLHLLDARAHFLLGGDGHGAAAFGLGLAHLLVGLGALGFEQGADVGDFARAADAGHADVGDIDRDDLEGGLRVEAAVEHLLADLVGVLEHVLVAGRGADGADDALADAGDDGVLGGAADEAVEVGAHGHAGLDQQADAVLGHGVEHGACPWRDRGSR